MARTVSRAPVKWWAQIWDRRLGEAVDKGRVSLGRRLARKVELKVTPGKLSGRVVYASRPNARASFRFPKLDARGARAMAEYIAGDPEMLTALVSGEFPRGLWRDLESRGVEPIPEFMQALGDGECSLRERDYWEYHVACEPPCPHQIAVWCAAASAFGDDPFLLLTLLGVSKDEVLAIGRTRGMATEAQAAQGTMAADAVRAFWLGTPRQARAHLAGPAVGSQTRSGGAPRGQAAAPPPAVPVVSMEPTAARGLELLSGSPPPDTVGSAHEASLLAAHLARMMQAAMRRQAPEADSQK